MLPIYNTDWVTESPVDLKRKHWKQTNKLSVISS